MIINIISDNSGGGAELLVRELHKIYLKRGIDSHVFYFSGDDTLLYKNETIFDLKKRDPRNILKIRKLLKKHSSKTNNLIVHSHLTWPFIYTVLASIRIKNISFIFTEHNTYNRRRKLKLNKHIERLFYKKFSKIICISEGVRNSLSEWLGRSFFEKIIVIKNGSRLFKYKSRSKALLAKPRLISIGSLSSRKNFSTTIQAINKIIDEIDSYTIIGEGSERQNLETLINDLGIQDKVHLPGWSDDIETSLHDADIQLIPSLWEGFGLVAVEGMSTGLPIIASNVAGLREVLDPSNPAIQLIDEIESPNDWAAAISTLINTLQHRNDASISEASRHQAEKFSLETMADGYLSIYNEIKNIK